MTKYHRNILQNYSKNCEFDEFTVETHLNSSLQAAYYTGRPFVVSFHESDFVCWREGSEEETKV